MNIKIEKAVADDIKEINNLIKDLDEIHFLNMPNIFEKIDNCYMESTINNKFVAKYNDKVVGFLEIEVKETPQNIHLKKRKYLWIENIIVKKDYRKKGIGRLLVKKAIEFANNNNINEVELNVWEFKDSAIKFYEMFGFDTMLRRMSFKI